ncbi:MAG: hypothetical protein A3J74_01770 [Elusimicrobia bacterium RIFCSPHIGHO2_02_FULL_57_9]|nr:MAG: hypothetical protein A3J74_01770 [Elusimicrobia bacterium RIFCSPHIGHO2_02_FULL_57_9]
MTESEELTQKSFLDVEEVVEETEEKEEKDPRKVKQRKPPSDGLCRRCGENKPINRLMLCYPCWVKTVLEARGWREGMPHPDDCGCSGLGAHCERLSEGN